MKKQNILEIVVGIFVLLGLTAVFIIVMSIASQQHLFVETYRLQATFRNVSGLKAGAPVFLSGVEAGTVESLSFTSSGWVQATLLLRADYRDKIRKNSVATIGSVGLLGDKSVEISMGTQDMAALKPGGYLKTEEHVSITDILDSFGSVRDRLQNVLDNLGKITGALVSDRNKLEKGLSEATQVLENLNSGQGSLGMLIRDDALYNSLVSMADEGGRTARALEEVSKKAVPLMDQVNQTAQNVKKSSENYPELTRSASRLLETSNRTMEKLGVLADDLAAVSKKLPAVIESLRRTAANVEEATNALPDTARSIRATADESRRVVEAAKGSWLIKGAFPKNEEPGPMEVDGR